MSSADKLARFFQKRPNRWIPLPALGAVMSPYSITKRVSELRKRGLVIENRVRYVKKEARSEYKLVA